MFEHSVKVPRHYKVAASIFKKISTEGGSLKSLLYDDKLKHFRINVLYALINETIKHAADIDKIFENSCLLDKETRLDPWLAKVLTAELLFGKKTLPGKSKPEQTILTYKDQFEKYTSDHQDDLKTEVVRRPRYVRVNTNLLTTSDAIRAFQDEGYRFIRCTSGSYDDYLKQIQQLTEYDFTQDYHVKTMFVFASNTKLHEHELYLESQIVLQDKATALPVHLLAPPPGSCVLDMCAAPGMKTTQLAAYMRNQGRVYAVERDTRRYQTLCDFVKKTDSKCVETMNKDCLEIKRGDLDDVEYILLDPSCTGSGMEISVHNYVEPARLAKLTSLQEKFLKHAMNSFPNAKRIVYSTCSIYPEENERAVSNAVKNSRSNWKVLDAKELMKGQWNNFGSGMYGVIGTKCLYARPDSDFTTGFFLAVLERGQKGSENSNKEKVKSNKNADSKSTIEEEDNCENTSKTVTDEEGQKSENPSKKKKKKNTQAHSEMAESLQEEEINAEDNTKKKKKKHKSNDVDESPTYENAENLTTTDGTDTMTSKKKKKKKDKNREQDENAVTEAQAADDVKKKKKKRKLEEVDEQSSQDNLEVSEIEEVQKKKKKKRNKNNEIET
ncbi:28S rRNA (cytosine-C(5))-methyltransferase [Ostrinia nubilalis]|uniref:28S rRNA (cytosine-C(5))-methyltransferase n=1 Tax=Ostrinia nubilalis TaxID=29057 RepID=UPI0030822EC8